MPIRQRSYAGEIDKRAMAALVDASPNSNFHVADLPYRLSSWAFDVPENTRLWFNEENCLIAWAVLQSPFWTIDYAYSTETEYDLHREIITWADRRARKISGSAHGHPTWFINVFAEQTDRIRDLTEFGFASQANIGEDSWSKVLMIRSAKEPVSACQMPSGYAVRTLAGENEIEAYVNLHQTAFESKNMTVDWRLRTLHHPGYRNDLDLVVIAPNGQMVAFCICWLNVEGNIGQIEPLGVHDDFRNLGLGRAILAEGIHRLIQSGATRLFVETDRFRNAAFALYESAGFRVEKVVLVYRKDYSDGQALS